MKRIKRFAIFSSICNLYLIDGGEGLEEFSLQGGGGLMGKGWLLKRTYANQMGICLSILILEKWILQMIYI